MADVRNKYVPPALNKTAFNCPHCGALAKQFWFSVHAEALKKDALPFFMNQADLEALTFDDIQEPDEKARLREWAKKAASGIPYLESNSQYRSHDVHNLNISKCFNCNDVAIWIHNKLMWPQTSSVPLPNPDLPSEIKVDYEEAGTILTLSPRGSAALLRLCVQKLCRHLGEKGKNIDDDIAALVKKGLDSRVQRALDIVRVVGNNSVHPGQMDLRDNRETAERLFGLVNLIAEIMITQPKHIGDMYESLPETALKAIEKRDG